MESVGLGGLASTVRILFISSIVMAGKREVTPLSREEGG